MISDQDTPESLGQGFAPEDYTDGRPARDWKSRYDDSARSSVRGEAIYLAVALLVVTVAMLSTWLQTPQKYLGLSQERNLLFERFGLATLAGILGGILFAMKWLYHTVAKGYWNIDRRLWRLFTPVISGGLAFFTILVVESFGVFDPSLVSTPERATAFGFLVGLFSDNALAKLAEVAQTLFGPTHKKNEFSAPQK